MRKSRPATRTLRPRGAGRSTTIVSPSRDVFSWITTVSVPAGSTPPVKMRAASPGSIAARRTAGRPRPRRASVSVAGRCRHILGAHRVAIHGGDILRRLRAAAPRGLGEHAALGFCERQRARPAAARRLRARARALRRPGAAPCQRSLRPVDARLAAALFDQMNALDAHAALGRLHHVVDREARDRHGGERLHLDAGLAFELAGRAHDQARELLVRRDVDLDLGQRERMAERDQFVRLLRRHDAGDARGAEHVALLGVALEHEIERLRAHHHAAFRDGDALGRGLVRHVHHAGFAALAEMGESSPCLLGGRHPWRGCARAALWSRRKHLSAASGFRRSGRSIHRPSSRRARSAGVNRPLSPTTT